jgi:hypothetical protein
LLALFACSFSSLTGLPIVLGINKDGVALARCVLQ